MITKAIKSVSDKLVERKMSQYVALLKTKTNEIYAVLKDMEKEIDLPHAIAGHLEVIAILVAHFKVQDRPYIMSQILEGIKNEETKNPIGLKHSEPENKDIGYVG